MFPVYMKRPGSEPPENSNTYYIIAKNGIMLRKKNDWVDAVVPVKQIAILDEEEPYAKLLLPPLSQIVTAKAVSFFRAVYGKYHTEAAVLLHYHPSEGWELSIPHQTASPAHVSYEHSERLEGYRCAGTMHSHARMAAFHSGTDQTDEATSDGIHITIGNMNRDDSFSMDAKIVVNGNQFALDLAWMEGVTQCEEAPVLQGAWSWIKRSPFYMISLSVLGEWQVPDEWIEKVELMPIYAIQAWDRELPQHMPYPLRPYDPYDFFSINPNS